MKSTLISLGNDRHIPPLTENAEVDRQHTISYRYLWGTSWMHDIPRISLSIIMDCRASWVYLVSPELSLCSNLSLLHLFITSFKWNRKGIQCESTSTGQSSLGEMGTDWSASTTTASSVCIGGDFFTTALNCPDFVAGERRIGLSSKT